MTTSLLGRGRTNDDARDVGLLHVCDPLRESVERFAFGDVVHEHRAAGFLEIDTNHVAEAFLVGYVPRCTTESVSRVLLGVRWPEALQNERVAYFARELQRR